MEIEFKKNNEGIIDKCLDIISKPKLVVVDSRAKGYLANRNSVDEHQEAKLLNSSIDGKDYYDELMKDF